jgi:predicted Fe-Mo cluster-binding NifX family protein
VTVIAIPIWQGRVSPVFDEAHSVLLVEVAPGKPVQKRLFALPEGASQRVQSLLGLGVSTLLCGAVTQSLERLLQVAGVRVISQLSGPAEAAVEAHLRAEGSDHRTVA